MGTVASFEAKLGSTAASDSTKSIEVAVFGSITVETAVSSVAERVATVFIATNWRRSANLVPAVSAVKVIVVQLCITEQLFRG